MLTRTWPHGTRKRVQVLSAEKIGTTRILACLELEGAKEGYILDAGDPAAEGDFGQIVFCQGGPTGSYWRYEGQ
jgi:hypothetical protein